MLQLFIFIRFHESKRWNLLCTALLTRVFTIWWLWHQWITNDYKYQWSKVANWGKLCTNTRKTTRIFERDIKINCTQYEMVQAIVGLVEAMEVALKRDTQNNVQNTYIGRTKYEN